MKTIILANLMLKLSLGWVKVISGKWKLDAYFVIK